MAKPGNHSDKQAEKANRDELIAAIREGLADVTAGRVKPARTALKALAKKYGIQHDESSR